MKKERATATITRAKLAIDELTKYEAFDKSLDLMQRTADIDELQQLHEFLCKIQPDEYKNITARTGEIRFKSQLGLF